MIFAGWPLLSLLVALPGLGALAVWLARTPAAARALCRLLLAATLALALAAAAAFDPAAGGFQLVERAPWMPQLGIGWHLGVDGLALPFLPVTAFLFLAAALAGGARAEATEHSARLYHSLLLALAAATLGVFCALDTVLFFLFWELSLLPLYFLVSLWGHGEVRQAAAVRYFFVMLAGGGALLFAFLILAHAPGGGFDLPRLLVLDLPRETQWGVFLLFLFGFGVKVPLVPLHTWLPSLALAAPAAVTAVVVGLKLGFFGLLRFAIPLAPQAALDLHWLLAGLGTLGILYASVAALAQSGLRTALAYGSVAHVGLAVLGLASFSVAAVQGALLLVLSFALTTGAAFLMLAMLVRRTGSADLSALGGVARTMPRFAAFFLLFGLAALGMPGTIGFPAELALLVAILHTHTGAGLAALFGLVVGAAAFLAPYRAACFGPVRRPAVATARDLTRGELALLLVFAGLVVAGGLAPGPLLEFLRPAVEAWVARLPAG